jgi:hypothetical protein
MESAIFIGYFEGYFEFESEYGHSTIFEEINPQVLKNFDLGKDEKLIGKEFLITYSEKVIDEIEDLRVKKIENLIMIIE